MNNQQEQIPLNVVDAEEEAIAKREKLYKLARWTLTSLTLNLTIGAWQAYVTIANIPHYILPSPVLIAQTLIKD